jgi:hypothetical protein
MCVFQTHPWCGKQKKPIKAKWLDKFFVRVKGSPCLWYDKHERFKVVAIEGLSFFVGWPRSVCNQKNR